MKFTLIASTFAALLATGYSETLRTPDIRNLDAVPVADLPAETEGGLINTEEGKRALVEDVNAADVVGDGSIPETTDGKRALGAKGAPSAGNKKDYSGQSCSLCCDDDYHC
jgi:hypothetical protein